MAIRIPEKRKTGSSVTPTKSPYVKKREETLIGKVKKAANKTVKQIEEAITGESRSSEPMLRKFFVDSLRDIYWAEKQLTKALPKMRKGATTAELQNCFARHTEETKIHIQRLEQIFELLGEKARSKKCEAMEGLIEEGNGLMGETESGTATRDVALILAAQKVEHYEIATYGGLAQLARTLGEVRVADILETTLAEEKEADILLTEIAEDHVNYDSSMEEED